MQTDSTPRPSVRVNLLHGHGSPRNYQYFNHGCRCVACKAAKSDADRARYLTHHDEVRERQRVYYAENTEKVLACQRSWEARNRDNQRVRRERRKLREATLEGSHTAEDLAAQFARQQGRCFWCKRKIRGGRYEKDHVVPVKLGGSDGPENIVVSCPRCNREKHAKHPMDWAGVML